MRLTHSIVIDILDQEEFNYYHKLYQLSTLF